MRLSFASVVFFALSIVTTQAQSEGTEFSKRTCKVIRGDKAWPAPNVWTSFNVTVGGNLIKSVPIGAPCFHGPYFDAARCEVIKASWTTSALYLPSSSAMQEFVYANNSCNPWFGPDGQCTLGVYPEYAVNVSSVQDVINSIKFAQKNNVRLIVKNTGHDYMGRSSGHGSLSIWTHYQQKREWFDSYKDPWSGYRGPAFRAHAGVVGQQLYTDADPRGYHIVGGECPTVGYVGGYIQGGGHSVMSGFKGMAADQVLSFEVITTTGKFVNASATENSDLFWALRGGGGGAYGIVWTVTAKAFHDVPMSVGIFSFTEADNGFDKYWKAQEIYHRSTIKFADLGAWVAAIHFPGQFSVPAFMYPNRTLAELTSATAPLFKAWDDLGLNYTKSLNHYSGYWKAIQANPGFQDPPINVAQMGGRLIPRSFFSSENAVQNLMKITKEITDAGFWVSDNAFQAKLLPTNDGKSAVYPQWRTMNRLFLPQAPYNATTPTSRLMQDARKLTDFDARLSALVPGGMGAYLNEADPNDPKWKDDFYGPNYGRLLNVKNKYDPSQLLWGKISVGGDRWKVQDDGRLCPV